MEGPDEEQNIENPEEKIRQLLAEKVRELCRKCGIENVKSEEKEGGVVFRIDPPEEHKIEHVEKSSRNLLNEGIKTKFTEESLMPFVREFNKEYGDYFDFKFLESGEKFTFKISRKKL